MAQQIKAIRGMNDILPENIHYWHRIEGTVRTLLGRYGYSEIRMPVIEKTELFKRSIGEVTDIVEKEMYTFDDRKGDSLTMRPEGTAGCVRAAIENGLLHNQTHRLWYQGAMFRYERPQKGRYRWIIIWWWLYWVMMSWAAVIAAWQFFIKPAHWEKSDHTYVET